MQIISGTTEFECKHHTAVAIGKFDGIHQGHRMLLSQILKAKEDGLQSAVFTFDPPPGVFFSGKPQAELTTKEEKRRVFDRMGIDLLIEFPMNAETAAMPPETFVREVLHDRLQTRFIAAGTDLSYGDRGKYRYFEGESACFDYARLPERSSFLYKGNGKAVLQFKRI